MHNRFGFSTKKLDPHRPSNPQSVGSASVSRVTSYRKANQPFAFGQETSSIGKLSVGKNFNNAMRPGMPSSIKSVGRPSSTALGFGSGRKNSVPGSKLFGATPQHSRASYMQQNRPSTSRLSRSSRGGKDNRPLSDQAFHRDCQDKILQFLASADYPHQFTKQTLMRPSLSDVSRIFEFLFAFFQEGIVIKNGANTSMEIVVPKMLAELGYPFQLKRSDLVSFSGGRQLGAILESICFVIGLISYIQNVDIERFNKNLELEEFTDSLNIHAQLSEIALEHVDEERTLHHLKTLSERFFGTEDQIVQMENEQTKLEQKLQLIEEETALHIELPNKIQECKKQCALFDEHLADGSIKEHQIIISELIDEIKNKEEVLQKATAETNELQNRVNSQNEIVMQYRLSIERRNQIIEEMEREKQQIQDLNEQILSATLEESKQRAQNSSFIGDLEDIITSFFTSLRSSKINQMSLTFSKSFEEDKEWKAIYARFKSFKDWDIKTPNDDLIRDVKEFGQQLQNKFKDFKHTLLEQLSSLKGSASIDLICEKQELKALLDKKRQHLAESETELAQFIAQKEAEEKEEASRLVELQTEIDSAKKQLIESEKANNSIEKEIHSMKMKNAVLEKSIKERRERFMKEMIKRQEQDQAFLHSGELKLHKVTKQMKDSVASYEKKLLVLSNYEKAHQ